MRLDATSEEVTMTADPDLLDRLRYLRELQDKVDDLGLLPHQVPPKEIPKLWLLEGGRGSAKSYGLVRYVSRFARSVHGARIRLIAPTLGDAVESCIDGPSGIRALDPTAQWQPSSPGGARIVWPNMSECLVLGTPTMKDVDRLRASGNRHLDAWEEMAANPRLAEAWEQASMGLRIGDHPHSIGATTPRPSKPYRAIRKIAIADGTYTHATFRDNPHLPDEWKRDMEDRYKGTRLGRQELEGELLEDIEGALWTAALLDQGRVKESLDMERVVIGVDPSGGGGDEQGIVVCGRALKHEYVIADRSCSKPPEGWGRQVVQAYEDYSADVVVWEANFGGDMVEATIRNAATMMGRPAPKMKRVWASRGKRLRAEPIAALYGDPDNPNTSEPRVHHLPGLERLEDQMLEWTPESGDSPDRVDACLGEGSLVLTSNGERLVETIAPGEQVWTRRGWRTVTAARMTRTNAEVTSVRLSNGRELIATPDHRILTERGWRTVDALVLGDRLSGWSKRLPINVVRLSAAGTRNVYDLTVDGEHEFLAEGIIVHNCVFALTELVETDHPVGRYHLPT